MRTRPIARDLIARSMPPSRTHWGHSERSAGGKAGAAETRNPAPPEPRPLPHSGTVSTPPRTNDTP